MKSILNFSFNIDHLRIWGEHNSSSRFGGSTSHSTLRSTAEGWRVFVGLLFFGLCPTFPSPLWNERGKETDWEIKRARVCQRKTGRREKKRGREEDRVGLAALAWGYGLCCHGNRGEEEEEVAGEGLVSVSWGRVSPLVCEPTSGSGWDNTPGGDLCWKAARL